MHSRNIDKQARLHVDPARIDPVQIIKRSFGCETGVDFEEVVSALGDVREVVVEDGHVVVASEKGKRLDGHLHVDV